MWENKNNFTSVPASLLKPVYSAWLFTVHLSDDTCNDSQMELSPHTCTMKMMRIILEDMNGGL